MESKTGAVRSNDVDHLRHDLINPIGFIEVAKIAGCVNWCELNTTQCINAALEHTCHFFETANVAHLAYAALFSMAAIDNENHVVSTNIRYSNPSGELEFTSIPVEGWKRLSETYKEGADKYGENNYLSGFSVSDLLNHSIEHLRQRIGMLNKEGLDLQHSAWGFISAIHSYKCRPELNENIKPMKEYYK